MAADQAFFETIKSLLSGDNALRNAAQERYEAAKKNSPSATVAALYGVLQQGQVEVPVREQAAVLLRQCCSKVRDADSTWSKLGESAQADIRGKLLQLLEAEPVSQVRRKVADCIQSLGNQLIDIDSKDRPKNIQVWPELMPSLMRIICDSSKESSLRSDCLWVVKELSCSVWQMLVASADQAFQVLQGCLADASETVRAEAAALFCSLIDNVETKEERKPFASLIPELSSVMAALASSSDSKQLNTVLQSLQTTTETADFFRSHIGSHFMPVLCGIAKSHSDEAARKYAFEVILTFVESKPKMVLKIPNYVEQALDVCVHFMLQLDDDVSAWAGGADEDTDGDEEQYTFGKEAMDRLAGCASKADAFPAVLEVLKLAIGKLFASGEWKQVVAGATTLSMIAEYVDDEATVLQMLQGIKMQLSASHPRVRYAAWSAVAQFSEDHAEVITSEAWASQLLPEFLKGLEDSCDRVALRSVEAFQHFGESVEREDLEPFVPAMMEKLGAKLQAGSPLFQKKAITFIAVIAGQVDDAFAPYYGQLMPILKQVIQATLHKVEERTLLGKCFECISLLARSVGREGFRADAELIMQAMIQATQVPNLPSNDPVKEYMMAASERICSTMKEDFLPFVPHILPGILEKFTLAPREFQEGQADSLDENSEVNLTLVPGENGKVKIMMMYSSELQDLKAALECVHTFVEELGKAYAPYVGQTAQALLPVFEFSMAEAIRDLAFETWGQLCGSAQAGGQVQVVSELVMEFLKRVLPKLEATQDVDVEGLKTSADGINVCLRKAGANILSAEQVRHLCQVAIAQLGESLKRREAEGKAGPDEDGDEEEDEEADEQSLRIALCEVAGATMEHHADIFVAESFAGFLALVQQWMQPAAKPDDKKLALFLACDFLEHLGDRVTSQWPQFLPKVLEDVVHQDAELRQPACYGASLAAKSQAFAPLALETAGKLAQVVTESRKRGKKKSEKIAQACADNALSALVEILTHHQHALASAQAQLWGVWLAGLPCQEDEAEGIRNHKSLLGFVAQERPEVVGEGAANVPRLLSILIDVYKTEMADEETSRGIGQLVLRLGETRLQSFAGQFSEKQKKKLARIVREAQKEAGAA